MYGYSSVYDYVEIDGCCAAPANAVCGGTCITRPDEFCCVGRTRDLDNVCTIGNYWCTAATCFRLVLITDASWSTAPGVKCYSTG